MKTSLALYIFSTFLALGSCLQCEFCSAKENSRTGSVQTCSPGQDSCGIIFNEMIQVGVKAQVTAKTCMSSSACKTSLVSLNLGKGLTTRTSIACCVGDACKTATVPPVDAKPNGRHCPACYTLSDQCSEEIIECAGPETQCISFAGSLTIGGSSTQIIMKGCASELFCAQSNGSLSPSAILSANITMVKCTAASGVMGVAPKATGMLLPVLSGYLLLKFLS